MHKAFERKQQQSAEVNQHPMSFPSVISLISDSLGQLIFSKFSQIISIYIRSLDNDKRSKI